jgi:hypothetical protein
VRGSFYGNILWQNLKIYLSTEFWNKLYATNLRRMVSRNLFWICSIVFLSIMFGLESATLWTHDTRIM